jgi:hypothetical protein
MPKKHISKNYIYDSVGIAIDPVAWGKKVVTSTPDGPTKLSTTNGVDTWTQIITYDSNLWPSDDADWIKS